MKADISINYIHPEEDWKEVSSKEHVIHNKELKSGATLETFCSRYAMGASGSIVANINIKDIPEIIKEIEQLSTANPTTYNITVYRNK